MGIRRSMAETPTTKVSKLFDDGRRTSLSTDEQVQSFESIPTNHHLHSSTKNSVFTTGRGLSSTKATAAPF